MHAILDHSPGTAPAAASPPVVLRPATADDRDAVEALVARAFGPGRFARTAFRVREAAGDAAATGFVALWGTGLAGSVRLTPVRISTAPAFLLGPLAVEPAVAGRGVGRALLARAVEAARRSGRAAVVLVGDLAYYGPSGFVPIDPLRVRLPGPVEGHRLLARGLGRTPLDLLAGELVADPS